MQTGALQGISVSLALTENCASLTLGPCCLSAKALIQPSALYLHLLMTLSLPELLVTQASY